MENSKQISINLKPIIVSPFSLIAIGLFVFSTLIATSVCEKFYGLVIGFILMLVAIPFHCLGSKTKFGYILSFLVNSVANGFSLSAYYNSNNIVLNVSDMLKACVLPTVLLFIVYLLVQFFPGIKKYICASAVIIVSIMLVVFVVLWIRHRTLFFSFGFFSMLLSLFYHCVVGVTVNNNRLVLRDISFGSFGVFIIISMVVLFILTEGEILDGLDIGDVGDGEKTKHKKNR